MPRIAFVGDCHGHIRAMYAHLLRWQERTGLTIDAVVQVGDFGIFAGENAPGDFESYWSGEEQAPIPTWVCPGNHESIAAIRAWWSEQIDSGVARPNLHLLPDGEIADVLGVKVGAIWGNYSPNSYRQPERVMQARCYADSGRVAMHIWAVAVELLYRQKHSAHMDVFISHDAASCAYPPGFAGPMAEDVKNQLGLNGEENPRGCPGFLSILDRYQPRRYYFGHFHTSWHTRLGKTDVALLNAVDVNASQAIDVREF